VQNEMKPAGASVVGRPRGIGELEISSSCAIGSALASEGSCGTAWQPANANAPNTNARIFVVGFVTAVPVPSRDGG